MRTARHRHVHRMQGGFRELRGDPAPSTAEIANTLAEPKTRERFAQSGLEIVGNTPAQFAAIVRRDYEKYGRLVRELKIRID